MGLDEVLNSTQLVNLETFLSSIASLTPSEQAAVATVYTESFSQQMRVCTFLSAACIIAALGTFQRSPASVAARQDKGETAGREPGNLG